MLLLFLCKHCIWKQLYTKQMLTNYKRVHAYPLWTVKSNKKKERKPRYDPGQNHGLKKPWCYPGFNK